MCVSADAIFLRDRDDIHVPVAGSIIGVLMTPISGFMSPVLTVSFTVLLAPTVETPVVAVRLRRIRDVEK